MSALGCALALGDVSAIAKDALSQIKVPKKKQIGSSPIAQSSSGD